MLFRTPITILKYNNRIDYNSKIVLLGSCFAENISEKFSYFKFQNIVNPFGIIFNPVSIENLISRVVNNRKFTEDDIFFHNDLWHCYEVHSELSAINKEDFLQNLNAILAETFIQISNATHIVTTFGTSWVYRLRQAQSDKKLIVANCHKVPQSQFEKEILSIEVIQKSIQNTIDLIQKINPNCKFIFTISPVRHIKDGFVENTLSKAHLISAIHDSRFKIHNYFPSYEIMMDELRDYRYYADDMLHPSKNAVNFIWQLFSENYICKESQKIMTEVLTIQRSLHHKPFNENSESHLKFLSNLNTKIQTLTNKFPQIKF